MRSRFPFRPWLTFFLFPATVFLTGCAKENAFDCVKSTGRIATERRDLPAFTELTVEDNVNILLIPDTVFYAEVKCGENLLPNVETKVTNGKLKIRNLNKCNWVRSYRKPMEISLHLPQIKVIGQDGYGTIRSAGALKSEQLFLHLTGAGDFDLEAETDLVWLDMYELGNLKVRGRTRVLKVMVMSSGKLNASALQATDASLFMAGDGDAEVNVTGNLDANITGRGNVFYGGNPSQVTRDGLGQGDLIRKDN